MLQSNEYSGINTDVESSDASLLNTPNYITKSDDLKQVHINKDLNRSEDEENNEKICRICLESENPQDLISPCYCKGDSAWIHRSCLDQWRSVNLEGRGFKYCSVCQMEFQLLPVIEDDNQEKKRLWKYRFYVTRDITVAIILWQTVIFALLFLMAAMDSKDHNIEKLVKSSYWGSYYLAAFVLFLGLLGLFGLIAYCCGWLKSEDNYSHRSGDCCDGFCCYGCYGGDCNCNGCDCGQMDSDSAPLGLVILAVIVVIFAFVGIFVGIALGSVLFGKITNRHLSKLWLKQQTQKYVVKDFAGRTDELPKPPNHYNNNSIDSGNNHQEEIEVPEHSMNYEGSAPPSYSQFDRV
jgi:hypothetical protein